MNRVKRNAHRFCTAAIFAGTAFGAGAVTQEEAQRLDTAYPPGSVVVCRSDLPAAAKSAEHTTVVTRGKVLARHDNLTGFDTEVAWHNEGTGAKVMALTFRSSERAVPAGVYLRIEPDSMVLTVPGAPPETVKNVLNSFRVAMAGEEHYSPYSDTDITDFPSYVTHKPGEPAAWCSKEEPAHE
ncbi:unnamed protein product [Peronospora farinosa]|uniref:Uncharacterized protein n=1 Tax=Peronospora farinosa TaxID=134698 RepID=A0ABN8CFK3_9STRA|nr:unnamed protein product [Peronospora farinosa]